MKKIAIIRGRYMNKAEMCVYEPLKTFYNITGYANQLHYYDIDKIDFPIKKLPEYKLLPDKLNKTIDLFCDKFFQKILHSARYMPGLINELRNKDIINVDFNYAYTLQAIKAKIKFGKKIIVRFSHNIPSFICDCQNNYFSKVDVFFAISKRAKETLMLEGVDENKIEIIPHGVDLGKFKPRPKNRELMKSLNIKDKEIIILFVGSMEKIKGVQFLMLAANKLLKDNEMKDKSIRFLLVGGGTEKKKMQYLTQNLEIKKSIEFMPSVSYEQIPYIYNLADIFVLPSVPTENTQEKFGMVLIESMASGVPVISTYCGAIPEVIGAAGILVQPADILSLYSSLKKLVLDEQLRKNLAKKGLDQVSQKYDNKLISWKIKKIYDNFL
jgi:glycosyltransferase involved in cell wall biosynthesis